MAGLAEGAIHRAIEALSTQDILLAQRVIDEDKLIDEQELLIEEQAIDMLALHQPMACDLRFITTAIRINGQLERIADLAVNISQRVIELGGQPLLKPLVDIPALADISRKMVRDVIDAFVRRDETKAKQVIVADPQADSLRDAIYREIVHEFLAKDPLTATRGVPLILISRHLERICDHAVNIAEDVIYMINAKVVKHHQEELGKE